MKTPNQLIINSPYEEPTQYWHYERAHLEFTIRERRRSAGYMTATPGFKGYDDPGIFTPIEQVNKIRDKVKAWRNSNYLGATSTTKRLLRHWQDPEERRDRKFFFCQIEAIETLIWLTEAPEAERKSIQINGDGSNFERWCSKMATGSGKTIVMSMIIAWQFLNKLSNPRDDRFSKYALIVAPGLTVKDRLQVLRPSLSENYYQEFNIVPTYWMERLRQGKIVIHNWHVLAWDVTQKQIDEKVEKGQLVSVDKRKRVEISDAAYVRQVLGSMHKAEQIIVINDEAHHAWRVSPETASKYGRTKAEQEEATIWIGGLDRIHQYRGILRCFDLSATPFVPSGKKATEEALFAWIVSDFGLNDAIESGLVKTPRVVIRDDSYRTSEYKSRLYHIYADKEVKDDVNRKVDASEPLPDLVTNAYSLLGTDWLEAKKEWEKMGHKLPPVMITIANRTETSARINYAFTHGQIAIDQLCDTERTLQIDSKVLESAEAETKVASLSVDPEDDSETSSPTRSKKQQAEFLRQQVNTVGKEGRPGEQIQHVISVQMLSEGWDAKTVTHIMGLRAFSSQLLCEQVIGRGLRRVSYDIGEKHGLFDPEYVNIFGIPFAFLPHEEATGTPPPPKPKTEIKPVQEKIQHAISWPNVVRIDRVYRYDLILNPIEIEPLGLDPYGMVTKAELAEIIAGQPNSKLKKAIGLNQIAKDKRMQTSIFEVALGVYRSELWTEWKSSEGAFLTQMVDLVSDFIDSEQLTISGDVQGSDDMRKAIIMLNMNRIVQHIRNQIKVENTEELVVITEKPHRSTEGVSSWYTSRPCEQTEKSHISHCVYDSRWEASEAYMLDTSKLVESFVKNDHLGFAIEYSHQGIVRRYYPDFIVRLANGEHLILEVKGKETSKDKSKLAYLKEWVQAVNNAKEFGKWHWDVSFNPSDLEGILEKYARNAINKPLT